MQLPPLSTDWLARLQQQATRPPAHPRLPLAWHGRTIGSVEPALIDRVPDASLWRIGGDAVELSAAGDLTATLHTLAHALLGAGCVPAWRDEQLAVTDAAGTRLGSVERGVVRLLGIATEAVHLLGFGRDQRQWVQQRAFDKPDDPGLWDTLVGGMVPAAESLERALERETWEEAGLRMAQLREVAFGGVVQTRRPSASVAHGYVVERLAWYRCEVPDGVRPVNTDGEVAQFALMDASDIAARLQRDEFTIDAALMMVAAASAAAAPANGAARRPPPASRPG